MWTAAGNQKMKNMISELWNGLSYGQHGFRRGLCESVD
ncbi:MAG: hypothetical protein ACLU80_06090 [Dorea sp.]